MKHTQITAIFTVFILQLLVQGPSAQFSDGHEHNLQNIHARTTQSLDGLWSIIVDPLENGFYNARWQPRENGFFKDQKMSTPSELIEYNFDTDEQLMVPGDWNTQKEKLYYYEGTIWYRKIFDIDTIDDSEYFIHFGAVNNEAIIYLNGEKVGSHVGGYTSFSVKVTDSIREKNNVLVLKVDTKRKEDGIPTINTDWWNYGGITRSVHVVQIPKQHVYDYYLYLDPETKSQIKGWVQLGNSKEKDKVALRIPELNIDHEIYVDENGFAEFTINATPKTWSPSDPKRYEVLFDYMGTQLKDDIGFRIITTSGSQILLNGEPIFLKGISIHEEAPFKTGRVTSIEQVRVLLQWAKELGCNYVRLAHYPHNEDMVREAERMGLMVWSEIPVYWTVQFDNNETYANAEHQLEEMIARDKNRASVVLWSIANETPIGDSRLEFLANLAAKARALDSTRLITAALDPDGTSSREGKNFIDDPLGEHLDVIGINYYCGWYGGTPESCRTIEWDTKYDKPMIMSEFGGGALQGLHGEENERWTEEYQSAVYRNNIEMLKNIEFLAGTSPWILMDFRSHRRHLRRIQSDFNRKGLISEQGVKKESFYIMQEYYNSIEY